MASEVIGHDPEESADSVSVSADDGAATVNETSDGVLLSETVYYADGTKAGVKTPDDGYWTTRYIGSLIYEGEPRQETLEGVVTDNGFIQWNGSAASSRMQYFLRDHLGSVRVIAEDRHTVIGRTDYLPFGVRMSGDGLTAGNATSRSSFFGFSGKENEMWGGLDTADGDITPHWLKGERYQHFGARAYDPVSCIFMQVDPMAEKYYGMSPYAYCHNNSINRFDFEGKWDIRVSAFSDRAKCPYAILTAYTRNGIAFFNTVVKVKGTSRDRLVTNADTPTGKYKIIEWRKTGSGTNYNTDSYGKNDLLALEYISGEAQCFGRTGVHLHGGRPSAKELKSTHGCIRISDGDILELKELISWLESNDNKEKAGYLYVEDNLDDPVDYSDKSEVQSALSYDGGELDPSVIEPGYYTFPLSQKFKYLDEQLKQRHGN